VIPAVSFVIVLKLFHIFFSVLWPELFGPLLLNALGQTTSHPICSSVGVGVKSGCLWEKVPSLGQSVGLFGRVVIKHALKRKS
jgi:hypothetical protein